MPRDVCTCVFGMWRKSRCHYNRIYYSLQSKLHSCYIASLSSEAWSLGCSRPSARQASLTGCLCLGTYGVNCPKLSAACHCMLMPISSVPGWTHTQSQTLCSLRIHNLKTLFQVIKIWSIHAVPMSSWPQLLSDPSWYVNILHLP